MIKVTDTNGVTRTINPANVLDYSRPARSPATRIMFLGQVLLEVKETTDEIDALLGVDTKF